MLILLPPSEGKTRPEGGDPLDLSTLSSPGLTRVREQLLSALVRLSATRRGAEILGLGPTQADLLEQNTRLREEPAGRADAVYTGVLFGELGLDSLDATARRRADERIAIASALFGLVRPGDRIPAYKLSGGTTLPRLGTVASRWKPVVPRAIADLADGGLVLDLRSGTYVQLGQAPTGVSTATMRVLHEANGKRTVVSHFNKATKGRIARALLESGDEPTTPDELVDSVRALGWTVEPHDDRLDVITT